MTTLLILGLGLGNPGMIWILAGHILLFPIIGTLHLITKLFKLGDLPPSETLVIVPSEAYKTINIVPSMWITQVTYFFSYLIMNANDVRNADAVDSGPEYATKVNNRKTRTIMIMTVCAAVLTTLILCRIIAGSERDSKMTGIVTAISVTVSVGLGLFMAGVWDLLGGQPNVGIGKLDIFGISQQMMKIPSTNEKLVCEGVDL